MKFLIRLLAGLCLASTSHAATMLSTQTLRVDSRTAMAAIDVAGSDARIGNGDVVILEEAARAGMFRYTTSDISTLVTDDPQQCLVVARGDDTDGSTGGYVRVSPSPEINVEFCGAIPSDNVMDTTAIQAAINIAEEFGTTNNISNGGTVRLGAGIWDTNAPLVIDAPNVCIKGVSASELVAGTIIKGDHTDGPVIRIKSHHWCAEDFMLHSSTARRAATLIGSNYTGLGKTFNDQNYGFWVEGDDSAGQLVGYAHLKNVWVHNQPNSSFVFSGQTYETTMDGGGSRNAVAHGFVITDGTYTGRTNTDTAGLFNLRAFESYGNTGHPLVVGFPTAARGSVIRMLVDNFDSYNNATDDAVLLSGATEYEVYFVADNSRFMYGAINGEVAAADDHGGMYVAGRQVEIVNTRLLDMASADSAIYIQGTHSGANTSGIDIRWPTLDISSAGGTMACIVDATDSGSSAVYVFEPAVESGFTSIGCGDGIEFAQGGSQVLDHRSFTASSTAGLNIKGAYSQTISVADDDAAALTMSAGAYGIIAVTTDLAAGLAGQAHIKVNTGGFCNLGWGTSADVVCSTGVKDGNDAADGDLTISPSTTTNVVYVENRTGGTVVLYVSFMGSGFISSAALN